VVGEPTLQVVGAVSGEDCSSGEIVGGVLLHGEYLPLCIWAVASRLFKRFWIAPTLLDKRRAPCLVVYYPCPLDTYIIP
jgi:hypothetical protein